MCDAGLNCYLFGSPPVLTHKDGSSRRVLALLGLQAAQVRAFVLQNDPVPRAMLAADPAFSIVKKWSVTRQLLELRGWFLGQGAMFSTQRFLYDKIGHVYLITWAEDAGGCDVQPLSEESLAEALAMDGQELISQPGKYLAALLDHHHGSYTQELQTAALKSCRAAQQRRRADVS